MSYGGHFLVTLPTSIQRLEEGFAISLSPIQGGKTGAEALE